MGGALHLALATMIAVGAPEKTTPILVLPVDVRGRETEEFLRQLTDALHEGLQRGRYTVMAAGDGEPCESLECAPAAARAAGAELAVRLSVDAGDRVYSIAIVVVDASTSRVLAEAKDVCDLCGLEEVKQMVDEQAAAIRSRLDALGLEAPIIAFESEPPAATIILDGRNIGRTPLERQVDPGEHLARAELEGRVAQERSFSVVAGVRESIRFRLAEIARPDTKGRAMRAIGWTALGIGLPSLGVGAALLAIDHDPIRTRCSGANIDPMGNCKYIYLTRNAGIALVVVGGVLLATSIGLLVAARKRHRRDRI